MSHFSPVTLKIFFLPLVFSHLIDYTVLKHYFFAFILFSLTKILKSLGLSLVEFENFSFIISSIFCFLHHTPSVLLLKFLWHKYWTFWIHHRTLRLYLLFFNLFKNLCCSNCTTYVDLTSSLLIVPLFISILLLTHLMSG